MTVDLTGVSVALIAGVFSILSIVIPILIQQHFRDKTAAADVSAAVRNALGAMQQAATGAVMVAKPHIDMPGIPESLQNGVQYVLDNAAVGVARAGLTPEIIAGKISAQIGLKEIATNLAVAGSPAAVVPDPLGPVPVMASDAATETPAAVAAVVVVEAADAAATKGG